MIVLRKALVIALLASPALLGCTAQRQYSQSRADPIEAEFGGIIQRAEQKASTYRESCNLESFSQATKDKSLSFEFMDAEKLEKSEAALHTPLVAWALYWSNTTHQYLRPRLEQLKTELEQQKTTRGILNSNSRKIDELSRSIEFIESYIKPRSLEDDLANHFNLSVAWYDDIIRRLKLSSPVWLDYSALINIERQWFVNQWSSCISYSKYYFRNDPNSYKKVLVDGQLVRIEDLTDFHQNHYKLVVDEIGNTLFRILQNDADIMSQEIKQIKTESQLDSFFSKYLGPSAASYTALKKSGLLKAYEQKRIVLLGDPSKPKNKYKN